MIGPLGFAGKNLSRRGFHALLAFLGLTLTVASTTFLLLMGQGLALRLGIVLSPKGTFGINWLFFGYLALSLALIIIVGIVSTSYLVSSMISQRMRDIGVIKAAGCLPGRLFSYAFAEGLLVIASSCFLGAVAALLVYAAWAWPSPNLSGQVGPIQNAGLTIVFVIPLVSFLISFLAARRQVAKIISSSTTGAVSTQLSELNLGSLGNPVHVKRFGSPFNLATRNVSRDRDLNKTIVRIVVCIFLTVVVLTGALVSADASKNYVERAMPANTLMVGNSAVLNQYTRVGTAFSSDSPIPSFDYTNPAYIISQQNASSFREISGVQRVDTRLITMTSVEGFIKAHLTTNETSGNFNDVYVPEQDLGSGQALLIGVDPNSVIGNWYSSNGFLNVSDRQTTMIAGDSFVGGIVQMPFSLAQIGWLSTRYDIKSAVVDPLNAGRVLYTPVGSIQKAVNVTGYNILLIKTDNNPTTTAAVERLASSFGLIVGSMDSLLKTNLSFLDSTWSFFFILPILTLVLTCGILLSYLTTNFSRRFNDYLVLRVLGAKAGYRLQLLLWEAWGLLAVCMVIAIPLAWLVSIFFLLPEAVIPMTSLELSALATVTALTAVSVVSAIVYSRRLGHTSVKDLRF